MRKGISKILAVSLTLVVMIGAAAGGWYYLNQQWNYEKQSLQNQADNLNKQLDALRQSSQDVGADDSAQDNSAINNFLTYTSTDYRYSFQYPKSFYLVDWLWNGQNSSRVPQNGRLVWLSKTHLSEQAIPMDADPVSQYFSVTASVEEYGLSAIRGDGTGLTISDTTVSGEPAWKVVTSVKDEFSEQYTTTYYVNYQSRGYAIQIVNSDAKGTHDAEADAIVTSFQFN